MKVLFVTPYFPPEVGAAQTRIYELAVRLQRMGHDVTVLTTIPNYPSGVVPVEWTSKFFWKGSDQGITIYRIWSYAAPNRGFIGRILSQITFALFSAVGGIWLPSCDFMIVESPPLFDGFAGVFLSFSKRVPYLFMVSDLWPEAAVQMGILRNSFLIWASRQMELWFYRRAAAVLALTAGIARKIAEQGVTASKVLLFRNAVNCEVFRPGLDARAPRHEVRLAKGEFVVLYAGTFGLAQGLTTVLETAALFQESGNEQVRFVLIGDGAESELLKSKSRVLGLSNVSFLDPLPKSRMPELLNAADCVIVPLRKLEIFLGALPTKMFEAMACAKPVILGIEGEAEQLLRDADAGICVPPEDEVALHKAILQLMKDQDGARRMGGRGREYIVRFFNSDERARQLSEVLERLRYLKSGYVPA